MLIHAFAGDDPRRHRRRGRPPTRRSGALRGEAGICGVVTGRWPRSAAPVLRRRGIRAEFPVARPAVHGRPLVYLDNAATTQKPRARDRRRAALLRPTTTRTSIAASTPSASGRRTPTRTRARRSAPSSTPAGTPRSSSRGTRRRASTWSRARGATRTCGAGDEVLVTAHGAPLEHRALAAAVRADRRRAARRRRSTTGASC